MGFSVSWIAFEGLSKADALERLGLADTGEPDEANEAPLSCAELPTGWTVIVSHDFAFASEVRLGKLSQGVALLGGQVEEHVMYSAVRAFHNGTRVWRIVHDSSLGLAHLDADGALPEDFPRARDVALEELHADGGDASEVDYLFDVPLEVAADLCGWRHDLAEYDWGEPAFTIVGDPADARAMLAKFFGR